MRDIEAFTDRFLKDISALPEEQMRINLLCSRLSGLLPLDAALFIESLYMTARNDKTAGKSLSLFLDMDLIKTRLGVVAYERIGSAAIQEGLRGAALFFSDYNPRKQGLAGYDTEQDAAMEALLLGTRRSLARTHQRDRLARLLSDPDPVVIKNLLDNPKITEREVLKIVSKRPNSEAVIKTVAANPKWSRRYDVAKAIILNPYSPPKLSMTLLNRMLATDLLIISGDNTIHPEVRSRAGVIASERDAGESVGKN